MSTIDQPPKPKENEAEKGPDAPEVAGSTEAIPPPSDEEKAKNAADAEKIKAGLGGDVKEGSKKSRSEVDTEAIVKEVMSRRSPEKTSRLKRGIKKVFNNRLTNNVITRNLFLFVSFALSKLFSWGLKKAGSISIGGAGDHGGGKGGDHGHGGGGGHH